MLDLRHVAARYRLALLDSESLVRVADALLEEGRDTPAIIQLSILESPVMADAGPLFERVCAELKVAIPTEDEAFDELRRLALESDAADTDRLKCVEIDLTNVTSEHALHRLLMERLQFPEFYGKYWDAFWDAITGLVQMPEILRLKGWSVFRRRLPQAAKQLSKCLEQAARCYPAFSSKVEYL